MLTRHSAARGSRLRVPRRRRSRTRPGRGETAEEAGRDRRSVKPSAGLGLHERLRREPGHVPDAAEGAEEPDAQPDADGGGAWNECVT